MFDDCLTGRVELYLPNKRLTNSLMQEQNVTTREFLRNFKKISAAKKVIIVANHGKPEGVYLPYGEWEKQSQSKKTRFNLEDLEKFTFRSGYTDLSQKIDEILYGKKTTNKKKK